jgi:hypothetical protein
LHAGQARLGQLIVGLIKIFEAPVVHIVAAVRTKTVE